MKVQQQKDGTWIAEQRDGEGRLQIAEALSQDGAWYAMLDMMGQLFNEQADILAQQAGVSAYGDQ